MGKRLASAALGLVLVSLSPHVSAERAIGRVTSVGCENTSTNTCWVNVEGYTTSIYCNNSGQLRWNAGTTWGARWYATLLALQLAGGQVHLEVDPNACGPNGAPTFMYGFIVE